MGYTMATENPILKVLSDQLKNDPKWSRKNYTGYHLLSDILKALDENQLDWPNSFNLLSSEVWIERMRFDPLFYNHHARNKEQMISYEDLLMNLAANFLMRTFILVPILDEDPQQIIEPITNLPIDLTYEIYIAYCNKLRYDNFFISVCPKQKFKGNKTHKASKSAGAQGYTKKEENRNTQRDTSKRKGHKDKASKSDAPKSSQEKESQA